MVKLNLMVLCIVICFAYIRADSTNPFLNKVCLDASNGCDATCQKRSFSFVVRKNGMPNALKFTCCLCDYTSLNVIKTPVNSPAVCPYDPNCRSPFTCGAYMTKVLINGVILDCQKCDICDPTEINDNMDTPIDSA